MDDTAFRMIELAGQGFQCSQILLTLGLEAQGKTNPDLIRVMNALAGGLGHSGDTCGALTGGACLIGLYAGRGTPDEEEDPHLNVMIQDLVVWFTQEFASCYNGIRCDEILGDDPTKLRTVCPKLVADTYAKVQAILLESGFDLAEGR